MQFRNVFVGGTFDGLHRGHQALIARAFSEGADVTIGLTSDLYVEKFKKDTRIASYEERKEILHTWLLQQGWVGRFLIIPIDDPYEPAASSFFEAILVTANNKSRVYEINIKRAEHKLPPLEVIEVPLLTAEDGQPISSTRIRNAEIDREGKHVMPEHLRSELGQPLGMLVTNDKVSEFLKTLSGQIVITVGDMTTKAAIDAGLKPSLAIIDLLVERKPFQPLEAFGFMDMTIVNVQSGPGFISHDAVAAIKAWREHMSAEPGKTHIVLVVEGEEDLLVLPAVENAPNGAIVLYGQPGEGLVKVEITDEEKEYVGKVLAEFT